jgi:hypothetical protein
VFVPEYLAEDVIFTFSPEGTTSVHLDVVTSKCWDCGQEVAEADVAFVSRINGDSRYGYEPCCVACA